MLSCAGFAADTGWGGLEGSVNPPPNTEGCSGGRVRDHYRLFTKMRLQHLCRARRLAIAAHGLGSAWVLAMLACILAPRVGAAQDFLSDPPLRVTADSLSDDVGLSAAEADWAELVERLRKTEARITELESSVADVEEDQAPVALKKPTEEKSWYEKFKVGGYTQFRINETVAQDAGSAPAQHVGDSSVGPNQGFSIRRARLVLQGDVTDHIFIYFQPEFAASVPGSPDSNHYVQLRDWYSDLYIDEDKVCRVRLGQSKVPYGWENLQSSGTRVPLDRNDGLNSAVRNERDLGAFFYWTPEYAQEFFKYTQDEGLKGSGNYGVFGVGFYNGQGGRSANRTTTSTWSPA